jgi:hypothetical protein
VCVTAGVFVHVSIDRVVMVCAGCDLRAQVLELREKRLDQEEVLAEFQKVIEELKKAHERHSQRLRQVEKDLAGASAEISRFQQEKQQRLNQVDVVVSLTLSQIFCLVPGAYRASVYVWMWMRCDAMRCDAMRCDAMVQVEMPTRVTRRR